MRVHAQSDGTSVLAGLLGLATLVFMLGLMG